MSGANRTHAVEDGARRYPARPVVAVGGVVIEAGRVLLVKRRFPPLAGRWSLPGGGVEVGETLAEALVREMREETGLGVSVGPLVDLFDRITRDADGQVQFHYVLADYLCARVSGTPTAGSDVAEIALADADALEPFHLTEKTRAVINRAREMASATSDPTGESA